MNDDVVDATFVSLGSSDDGEMLTVTLEDDSQIDVLATQATYAGTRNLEAA